LLLAAALASAPANAQPAIDPELRDTVRSERARVLVELRVETPPPPSIAAPGAIAEAQREVLARLGSSGVSVVRPYSSIPWLALEVDASALARLEAMHDLVLRVLPDARLKPLQRPSGAAERDGT
jgi:hypothetical protein